MLAPIQLLIMGPKQQNNTMVDEIKALIDTKFEELTKKIDTIQDKIDANHDALQIALEKTDQKVQKAIDQSNENQEELKHLKFQFDEHEERYNKQQNLKKMRSTTISKGHIGNH